MSRSVSGHLAGLLTLLGLALLLIGLFLPWIIRIIYFAHAGCPSGPICPSPWTDARSYWTEVVGSVDLRTPNGWLSAVEGPGALAVVIVVQGIIMVNAWQGHVSRRLLAGGVLGALVALAIFLLASWVQYCLFFCPSGHIVPPGVFYEGSGLWGGAGVRFVAPGFWLLLGGFLVSMGSDVALLIRLRHRTQRVHSV